MSQKDTSPEAEDVNTRLRRKLLRKTLAEVQADSIDQFILWWERYAQKRTQTVTDRRGLTVHFRPVDAVVVEADLPSNDANFAQYDLGDVTSHWQELFRWLIERLPGALVDGWMIECGPVFDIESNAFPIKVDENSYLILVNQGWIQFGRWALEASRVIDSCGDPATSVAMERKFRSLPRLACEIIGDDSLDLEAWFPEPDPVDETALEDAALKGFVSQGESFVVLHELSHILLGHLDRLTALEMKKASAEETAQAQRGWEFEADAKAVQLLTKAGRVNEWVIGVLFWMINTADQYSIFRFEPSEFKTHPPAYERLKKALTVLGQFQRLENDPDKIVEVARSLEPSQIVLAEKAEEDDGPWNIVELQLVIDEPEDEQGQR